MEDEPVTYIGHEKPNCAKKWLPFNPDKGLSMLMARSSGRVSLGLPYPIARETAGIHTEQQVNSAPPWPS
ncbi:hypothetical protein DID88_000256 [Monilinia fructigena]|uniref:Uncharacterized protein n=1 Tax=Monilinia fructigena TaxID=38457 RepID=A0A395IJZ0_9HELO|nr:hypothetical protein DID88_000256 [Monilinia fructigena]